MTRGEPVQPQTGKIPLAQLGYTTKPDAVRVYWRLASGTNPFFARFSVSHFHTNNQAGKRDRFRQRSMPRIDDTKRRKKTPYSCKKIVRMSKSSAYEVIQNARRNRTKQNFRKVCALYK